MSFEAQSEPAPPEGGGVEDDKARGGALATLQRVLRALDLTLKGFTMSALVLMVVFVFTNAFLRYVFHSGLTWSEELSRYLFVWVVFMGAIIATHERGHLAVDLITARLSWMGRRVALILANIVYIVVLVFLADGLIRLMNLNAGVPAPVSGIPRNSMYLAGLVAAIAMIAILAVQSVVLGVMGRLEKHVDPIEAGAIE